MSSLLKGRKDLGNHLNRIDYLPERGSARESRMPYAPTSESKAATAQASTEVTLLQLSGSLSLPCKLKGQAPVPARR